MRGGRMVKRATLLAATAGLALLGIGAPGSAQLASSGPAIAGVSASTSVSAFYSNYKAPSIWFRNGAADPGTAQLVSILKRAPFDGLASGPQLAAQVEAALAQAASGKPEDATAAERVLSTA